MQNSNTNYQTIPGWNVDADPRNEPTYPMKNYTGDDHKRLNWERPPLQPATVEVLHSNERPGLTAVFGTSNPPSGLSGIIRRQAFKFSEGDYGHWFTLVLADRINVVEGIIDDIRHGFFPNIFAERGMKADWKYNRKELLVKTVVTVVIATALVLYFKKRKK